MSNSDQRAPATPYRGIHPFRYIDHAYYFGREDLIEELLTKIMLYRMVILFGESGVGKSSLLNAGVIVALKKKGYHPERLRVQPFKDQPLLVERIQSGEGPDDAYLPSIFFDANPEPGGAQVQSRTLSLPDFRSKLDSAVKEVYPVLIFDQFEELFTLFKQQKSLASAEGHDPQSQLIQTIIDIVTDTSLKAKIVIALREDFLAKLDVIAKGYPQIFDHRVHVRLLNKQNALGAILRPFDDPNPFRSRLTPELADAIVEQLSGGEPEGLIQPTQLQIICRRLWEKYAATKAEIGPAEFEAMGEVKGVLTGFLTSELAQIAPHQRESAIMILENLITDSGTRDVVSKKRLSKSLAEDERFPISELDSILSNLQKRRLINEVAERETFYYDLASEFLVEAIQKESRDCALKRHQHRQRKQYLTWSVVALIVLAAIAAGVIIYQRREERKEIARIEKQNAEAEAQKNQKEALELGTELARYRSILESITDLADEKPETRRIAQDSLNDLAKKGELPDDYLPLIAAVTKQYGQETAKTITKSIEQAVQNSTTPVDDGKDYERLKPRIYMHITDDSQKEAASRAASGLKGLEYLVPPLQKVSSGPPVNELRYFKASEEGLAKEIAAVLEKSGVDNLRRRYIKGYESSRLIRPKHFELWFASARKSAF